jgi:VanZ family protein
LSGERAPSRRDLALAVLLAGAYGASDEFHQLFSAGRGAAPLDVGIDTLGAAAGIAEWLWLRQRAAAK